MFEIFTKYCANDNSHFTKDEFIKNLELKRGHQAFQSDMHALLPTGLKWNFDEAYQFIKLYDILRDMDMPLTPKQMSVFEKVQEAQLYSTYQGA